MARDIDAEIEEAIDLIVACQEKHFAEFGSYYTGPPYALAPYGWVKPAPWITVITEGGDDDFVIYATHEDSAFSQYTWRKSGDPQLERAPREES